MPIINPMMNDVLKEAGLVPAKNLGPALNKFDLKLELDSSGLDIRSLFEGMVTTLQTSDNETLKQKVRDTALKMHGVLKENQTTPPAPVTIVINDPHSNFSINPILIPRHIERESIS